MTTGGGGGKINIFTKCGSHSVCVCVQHQNAKLISDSIPELTNYNILLEQLLCRLHNRQCMLHFCEHCPGLENLRQYLLNLLNNNEFFQKLNNGHNNQSDHLCWRWRFLLLN